jgi:uncharacterized membrane protein YjjB (DUF3815 family)
MPPDHATGPKADVPVTVFGLEFSREFIREVGPLSFQTKVPVREVHAFQFKYATLSNRPATQILIGAALLFPGCLAFRSLVRFVAGAPKMSVNLEVAALSITALGLWLIFDARRKQPHLVVITGDASHKLRLLRAMDEASMRAVREAATRGSGLVMS